MTNPARTRRRRRGGWRWCSGRHIQRAGTLLVLLWSRDEAAKAAGPSERCSWRRAIVPVKVQREGENCLRGRKQKEEGQIRGGDEGLGLMDLVPSGDSGDLPAGGGLDGERSSASSRRCEHNATGTAAKRRRRGDEVRRRSGACALDRGLEEHLSFGAGHAREQGRGGGCELVGWIGANRGRWSERGDWPGAEI